MAVEVVADGSQTAVIGTEHTLHTAATPGVFVCAVDTRNMVNGDVVELRALLKVRAADAGALVASASYAHRQGDGAAAGAGASGPVVKLTTPIASAHALAFTLKQTAGTGRAFPWSVVSV